MAKEILSAQHARDELEKNEVLAEKIKKLLIPSLISSVLCVGGWSLFQKLQHADSTFGFEVAGCVWLAALVANIVIFVIAMVLGGKPMLKLMKNIALLGWFICPFPIDIVVGLFILLYSFVAVLNAPILIFIVALIKMKRDNKKYNEYLKYCPNDAAVTVEAPMQ